MALEDILVGGGLGAMLATLGIVMFFVALAVYVYTSLALMTIARKTQTEPAWLAWIPLVNVYLMVKVAGLEWWWVLGLLLGIIPIIGWLASLAWIAYVWWKISEKRSYPGWVGILVIVPFVNLIVMGVLAWHDMK